MPSTLLVKNAHVLVTMDTARREIAGGAVYIRDNVIEQVGFTSELPATADEVIDAAGHVVLPGLVNTHHHMFQSLTRAVPNAQNAELFDWLKVLYPIWSGLTPEMVRISTLTAMTELLLSGCTTTSDHLYLYPNGCRLEDSIEAAAQIGMRFHAARGAMSVGESQGGLPPDALVEDEGAILERFAGQFRGRAAPRTGRMQGAATRRGGSTARSCNTAGGRFSVLPGGFGREGTHCGVAPLAQGGNPVRRAAPSTASLLDRTRPLN